jgi:hypothetical protein
MSELERIEREGELVNVFTGELVNAGDVGELGEYLRTVREKAGQLQGIRAELERMIVEHARVLGTKTIHAATGDLVITGGEAKTIDDPSALMDELHQAGLPLDRVAKAVRTTIEYKPDWRVLKQLAAANDEYARLIEARTVIEEKPWRVSVR